MNLNQVTVPSLNLEESLQFYTVLGLTLIVKALPHYLRFEAPLGDATFSVHLVDVLTTGAGVTVYFEVENLDQKTLELQQKGISFDQLPEDKTWGWREAKLTDPDGNKLILFYGGKNRKNPPWRVKDNE